MEAIAREELPDKGRFEIECAEVQAAIGLVRLGKAVSVNLSGLRFGEAVADRLRRQAADQGIDLVSHWSPDDHSFDLTARKQRR